MRHIGGLAARRRRDLAVEWQAHSHPRAFAEPAHDVDLTAVQGHQALHDRQPEPGAVMTAVICGTRLEEWSADVWQVLVTDPDAGILDRDDDVARGDGGAHRHTAAPV